MVLVENFMVASYEGSVLADETQAEHQRKELSAAHALAESTGWRRCQDRRVSEPPDLSSSTVVKGAAGFCVALDDGRLPLAGDHPLGLYRDDCRHLRGYELRIAGEQPRLLGTDVVGSMVVYELANPA